MTTLPGYELLWLSCAVKRCCATRTVLVTGGDVWRIATRLDVPPESFLRTVSAQPGDPEAILLEPDQPPVRLALGRRAAKGKLAPCIFLIQLQDDVARCGLGGLRPLVCQAFPAIDAGGVVAVAPEAGCSCRDWTIADLDRPVARELLAQDAAERAIDRRIAGEWNRQIVAEGAARHLGDFYAYLMAAYGAAATGATV